MTKRDFFRLIIKLFGLFAIISTIFSAIPSNITFVLMQMDFVGILWIITTLIILLLVFAFLIYKPDSIIKFLRLDKGFDEERIEMQNFNAENIMKFAVIVIGGIVFIKNIPAFLSHSLFVVKAFLQQSHNEYTLDTNGYIYWITSGLNVLIGYYLMTNCNSIAKFLIKKNNKNEELKNGA